MIAWEDYSVADPDALETPAMLLFQDVMDQNIQKVCELVGGGQNLIAHVKTHKSWAVARRQVELGIRGFKCATLKELEMVLLAGADRDRLFGGRGRDQLQDYLVDGQWIVDRNYQVHRYRADDHHRCGFRIYGSVRTDNRRGLGPR